MEIIKDGFYTEPQTIYTIAIINNKSFYVAKVNNTILITNERVIFTPSIIKKWNYEQFKNKSTTT